MAETTKLNWPQLLDEALTAPGSLGNVYNRFWSYSLTNIMLFRIQGLHEPVASWKTWQSLGRHVVQGAKAKEVIVPLMVKGELDPDDPEKKKRVAQLVGFKAVHAVFGVSDTEGKDLPEVKTPGWDLETALGKLGIKEVPFESTDGNLQGYSYGLEFAINPVAVNRNKTVMHELGHIVLGHTMPQHKIVPEYHRGLKEFEAEATAYLVMNELEQLDEETASVSRGYIRHWLGEEQPPDWSIKQVFRAADAILKSGRIRPAAALATEQ